MSILSGKLNYIFINWLSPLLLIMCLQFSASAQQLVSIKTTQGEMVVRLYNETPIHKANFLKLVKEGFYDSLLFHRVIKDFMIQGGDPNSKGASRIRRLGGGGPGYTVEAEINNKYIHKKGALAAARQGDDSNPKRRSSGSQFYIIQGQKWPRVYLPKFEEERGEKYTEKQLITYESLGGAPHLDGQYTVFGEVVKGLNILDLIAATPTAPSDRPLEDVYILTMEIIK